MSQALGLEAGNMLPNPPFNDSDWGVFCLTAQGAS
jgi:hypothetical protein